MNNYNNRCERREYYDIVNIRALKDCDPCAWACLRDGTEKLLRSTSMAFDGDKIENVSEKALRVAAWYGEMDRIKSVYAVADQAYRYAVGKKLFYKIPDYNKWHTQLGIAVSLYRDMADAG